MERVRVSNGRNNADILVNSGPGAGMTVACLGGSGAGMMGDLVADGKPKDSKDSLLVTCKEAKWISRSMLLFEVIATTA